MNTHPKKQNVTIPDPMDHLNDDALDQQYFVALPNTLDTDDVVQVIQSKYNLLQSTRLRWRGLH